MWKFLLERPRQVLEIVAVGRRVGDQLEEQPSLQLMAVARRRGAVGGPVDRVVLHRSTSSCAGPGDVASVARGAVFKVVTRLPDGVQFAADLDSRAVSDERERLKAELRKH